MSKVTYGNETTALLVVDPYNDFISEGGKIWDRIKGVAEANNCVPNMLQVLNAAREAALRVFYALHHRYRPGDYETWKYIAPIQKAAWMRKSFEYGTWGGDIRLGFEPKPGEIVATEHWCSSGFANTDLDLQLKKHGIHQLHRHRPHRTYLHRSDRSLCCRAWLRGHYGKRRDCGLLGRGDARRSRS
jgi:ureidoacrylate peracid hydrolase